MVEIIILTVSVLVSGFVGLFVYARNPKLVVNRLYAGLTLSLVLFPISNYFSLHSTHQLFFIRAVIFFTSIAFALLYYLVFILGRESKVLSKPQIFGIYATIAVALLDFTPLVFSGVNGSGSSVTPIPNWGSVLFFAQLTLFPIYSIILLVKRSQTTKGAERFQNQFMLAGLLPILVFAPITGFIFPVIFKDTGLIIISPIYSAFFVSSIGYAIVKHRLFDIRFYAIRAAAYALTVLSLGVLYIAPAVYIMAILIMGFKFVATKFVIGVAFATVAALYFAVLHNWFDRTTSKIFFRDSYDSGQVLAELNKALVATIDLDVLISTSSKVILQAMKAEFCVFALNETSNEGQRFMGHMPRHISSADMDKIRLLTTDSSMNAIFTDYVDEDQRKLKSLLIKNNIAGLVKLSGSSAQGREGLGYLLVGVKRSGNSYNNKDAQTLEAMADVLAIAIQNALHFEEIQKFNVTLQQQVDDRTRQLSRTNAKLVALDETKDDFISMASHQLRTPLTSVKGYLSMVLEGDAGNVNAAQRKMLSQAFMSSQRMVYLIADLLNVSRLKTGKFVIERTEVDLSQLINQEIGQLRETAASHGLELKYDWPKDFPHLMLDETKTRQVVMNFIDNAVHYTPSGGHISVELKDKPHSVELRVRDDGIGVPKAEQHHLFTKFYRAANARRERPDGTGLGLFMAKKVIIAEGGAVLFESRENKGSVFGFSIPKPDPVDKL